MRKIVTIIGVFLFFIFSVLGKDVFILFELIYDFIFSFSPILAKIMDTLVHLSPFFFAFYAYNIATKDLQEIQKTKKIFIENKKRFSHEKIQRDLKNLLKEEMYKSKNNSHHSIVLEFENINNAHISPGKTGTGTISFLLKGIGNFYYEKNGERYSDIDLTHKGGIFHGEIKVKIIYTILKIVRIYKNKKRGENIFYCSN